MKKISGLNIIKKDNWDGLERQISIWMEGYAASGGSSGAIFLGYGIGNTFMEAYLNYIYTKYNSDIPDYVSLSEPVIWGCRCFNNEHDARKSFG